MLITSVIGALLLVLCVLAVGFMLGAFNPDKESAKEKETDVENVEKRIIVLDKSEKVSKLVGRVTTGYKVEGYANLRAAQATLTDEHRLDIRLFVVGDLTEVDKLRVRRWAWDLYMQGNPVIWFSGDKPPIVEIRYVVKTEPVGLLEEELGDAIKRALQPKE